MDGDSLSLSNLARNVRQKTPNTSEREMLLARLRERIRAGEYEVDAQQLADLLLKELNATQDSEMES